MAAHEPPHVVHIAPYRVHGTKLCSCFPSGLQSQLDFVLERWRMRQV
jgi:hypothetical protein